MKFILYLYKVKKKKNSWHTCCCAGRGFGAPAAPGGGFGGMTTHGSSGFGTPGNTAGAAAGFKV